MSQTPRYHSYLLRIWATSDQGRLVWRASLENPRDGRCYGFGTLGELCAFLQVRAEAAHPDEPEEMGEMGEMRDVTSY
ncbi:MAG: hypothetical protein ACLFTI_09875 [Anaerolineales bacterium]